MWDPYQDWSCKGKVSENEMSFEINQHSKFESNPFFSNVNDYLSQLTANSAVESCRDIKCP